MEEIGKLVEKIGLYVDLILGLTGLIGTASERSFLKQKIRIRESLRTIYFKPEGVLGLIDNLSKSKKIDPDKYSKVLTDFNDKEWKVESSLSLISFDKLADDLRVSLKTAKELDSIRYGKISVRSDIQSILNREDSRLNRLSAAEKNALSLLSKKIKQLNKVIVQLEDKLS